MDGWSSELAGLVVASGLPDDDVHAEFSLGMWPVVQGFKPSPITAEMTAASTPAAYQDVAA